MSLFPIISHYSPQRLYDNKVNYVLFNYYCQVKIHYAHKTETREMLGIWMDVATALCAGDKDRAIRILLQSDEALDELKITSGKVVTREVADLCDPKSSSLFRGSTLSYLQKFNYKEQLQELEVRCPVLSSVLHAAAESPSLHRNVRKVQETLIPGITTAAGILLNCRSQTMNTHQVLTSMVLKQSGAKKSAFTHLNSRFISSSYKTTIQRQIDFGLGFDKKVWEWAKEKAEAEAKERHIRANSTDDEWEKFQAERTDHGYQLIMDNVDLVVHPRHTSREKYGTDLHMVQLVAVKNRVEGYHLPNDAPIATPSSIDIDDFLPTIHDNNHLRYEWTVLIGNIISSHIPALKWFSEHIPVQLHHDHIVDLRKKSEVVRGICVWLGLFKIHVLLFRCHALHVVQFVIA